MSFFDFMQFVSITEQLKEQERQERLEELNRRKDYGWISDTEYEEEIFQIESDIDEKYI